jgi:hypothetical protein
MNILAAIKREERRLEKQLGKLNHELRGVRAAAKALGGSAEREVVGVKKRVLSAAGRAAIIKAASFPNTFFRLLPSNREFGSFNHHRRVLRVLLRRTNRNFSCHGYVRGGRNCLAPIVTSYPEF